MNDTTDWDDEPDDTLECPHCQREIYGDAEQCPQCGYYITDEEFSPVDSPAGQRPTWVVVTAVICLGMIAYWILGPLL